MILSWFWNDDSPQILKRWFSADFEMIILVDFEMIILVDFEMMIPGWFWNDDSRMILKWRFSAGLLEYSTLSRRFICLSRAVHPRMCARVWGWVWEGKWVWHLYCKYGMGKCTKYIRISASVSPRRRVCERVNEEVGHVYCKYGKCITKKSIPTPECVWECERVNEEVGRQVYRSCLGSWGVSSHADKPQKMQTNHNTFVSHFDFTLSIAQLHSCSFKMISHIFVLLPMPANLPASPIW